MIESGAAGDSKAAREELERVGRAIGLALFHRVDLCGPRLPIVTGSGTRLGPMLQDAGLDGHDEHVVPPRLPFRHEDGAVWARAAAGFATQAFLESGGAMTEP